MRITVKEIESELKRYKTNASKKAYMTRWIKASMEHLKDLNDAYKKRKNAPYGYLFGEKVYKRDVEDMVYNVFMLMDYKRNHFEK